MNKKLVLEITWWVATGILAVLFLLPILTSIGEKYPFYVPNVFFIIIFITFTRTIFLLKHTFLASSKILKLLFIFIPIPLFLYSIDALFNFQDFIDKGEHIQMLSHLHPDTALDLSRYMQYQFLFFGTGTIIVLFLMPVRMIVSIWRGINKGTV